MVAIRRVKRLIQFSIVAVLLATLLLFLQWNEISDSENLNIAKRGAYLDEDYHGLTDPEREFDVNEILKDVNGNNDAGTKYTEDDWETAFNEKAKHQVEKKNNFHDQQRKTVVRANVNHVDNRKLKQLMPNESQMLNITTANTITQQHSDKVLSTALPTAAVVSDKKKGSSKHSAETHEKEFHAGHDHHVQNNPTWKKFPWKKNMLGALNVHIWQAWCGSTIHDLRRNRFFPLYPDVRLTVEKFFLRHMQTDYGQRIFGYVHPPVTGKYTFAISSDDSSELWLSSDENPSKVKLIAWVGNRTLLSGTFKTKVAQFTKYKTQLSRPVYLYKGQKYFIEALHKQANQEDHILVGWKIPGLSNFRHLTGSSISAVIDDIKAPKDVTAYANYIPQDLPSHSHYRTSSVTLDPNVFKIGSDDLRDKAHKAKFVDERDIEKVFPSCPYNPSYLVDFKLKRYEGVNLIHDTALYPDDHSDLTHMKQYDQCARHRMSDSHGNQMNTLPPKLKSNRSLYENGSITVFRNSKVFLPLSFAKSAAEKEQAEEQLLETQMDLRDMKRLSQEVEDSTQSPKKVRPSGKGDFSSKPDQDNVYEMKNKIERTEKDTASVKRTEQSIARKEESPVKGKDSKDKDRTRGSRPQQASRVDSKKKTSRDSKTRAPDRSGDKTSRDRETHAPDRSRDDASRVSAKRQSENSRGTQRKLLSLSANKEPIKSSVVTPAPGISKTKDNLEPNRGYNFGLNMYNSYSQRGGNSSYSNSPQRRERIIFYPVDKQDDLMTRMNAAREFVRRMISAVQIYNHPVNSRSLMDAVYRRFGVKMKIPNIVRVPEYNTWVFHQNSSHCASDGNLLLNEEVAKSVVNRYMRALNQATNSKYTLKDIVNVEENHDVMKGDRYLIELELNVEGKNSSVRLSQYIYQKMGSTEFCLPQGFVLNQHATVHIIIPVKNQGKWVQHFIDNMVELYLETGDPHVNIIIVDFNSTDIDVTAAFKRSKLKRYQVKTLKGAFQRAYGIHAGAALVKNPRDIIFMCDLHLQIPSNIVDIIRKHCVQGKMAFAPIVARLHCGFSPSLPFGFWELQGYGLFAMYKSDFTRVGGMNYKEFRTTWGGEDWELLDRVLLYKMEVERLRVAKFYHYYHSKKGMWGSRNMFNSRTADILGRFDDDTDIIPLYNETRERAERKRFVFYRPYFDRES